MKSQILDKLVETGHDRYTCEAYWDALEADELPPAIAFFAIDTCFSHQSGTVAYWLRGKVLPALTTEVLKYLVEMRRRALKVRLEWPDRRHEWTNHINRTKHYAEQFIAD